MNQIASVVSKLFYMSSGVLGAKVISLIIIALLVKRNPESAQFYFEISVYSGLLGALFLIGVVFGLQVDGLRVERRYSLLLSFSVVSLIGLSLSMLLALSVALTLSSVLSSLVAVIIAYYYRNTNKGPKWQFFFIIVQQPIIFFISDWPGLGNVETLEIINVYVSSKVIYILTSFLILIFLSLVSLKVSLKSLEVFFVSLMTYLVILSGLEVSPDSSTFYVWLAVQIGGATVFLGNSISYYLMEFYRKASDGKVEYYYKVYDWFFVASSFLLVFVLVTDTQYDEFLYAILLTIQGVGKAASSMILTSSKYWTISVANILSAGFLFFSYQYMHWNDFRTTIIVLISANFISVLWIAATGRVFERG